MSKRLKKDPTGDYEVGYCKPPQANQFKRGESGNPRGRSKARKDDDPTFTKLLAENRGVFERGKRRAMTNEEIILRKVLANAVGGDIRSIRLILDRVDRERRQRFDLPEGEYDLDLLSKTDLETLRDVLEKAIPSSEQSRA